MHERLSHLLMEQEMFEVVEPCSLHVMPAAKHKYLELKILFLQNFVRHNCNIRNYVQIILLSHTISLTSPCFKKGSVVEPEPEP
jgi:hypothetical protein